MRAISRRQLLRTATITAASALPARAQAPVLRLGVLTDMSGPFKTITGPGSVAAVRQAVEDFDVSGKALRVEVLAGDHQNKPDIGASIARQWFDVGGVDVILDVPNSAVALAVQQVVREKNKVYLNASLATNRLTGDLCSPNTLHWTGDTYMLANSAARSLTAAGMRKWFLLKVDYALGHQLDANLSDALAKAGGELVGRVAYPFLTTTDFSSFLLQAQASSADVLAFANAGVEMQNCIKQAAEFGLTRRMKLAALLIFVNDVHALGLEAAQGLNLTESFCWDLNERTRAFTQRVLTKTGGNYPNMEHAGCYAAALHYLKVAAEIGPVRAKSNGMETVNRMKAMPFEDDCFGRGKIRKDGQVMVTSHQFQVKAPAESSGPWDCYRPVGSTPPQQAFQSLADGRCPFIND